MNVQDFGVIVSTILFPKAPLIKGRSCAIRLKLSDGNLTLVCIYLPTDTQTSIFS